MHEFVSSRIVCICFIFMCFTPPFVCSWPGMAVKRKLERAFNLEAEKDQICSMSSRIIENYIYFPSEKHSSDNISLNHNFSCL